MDYPCPVHNQFNSNNCNLVEHEKAERKNRGEIAPVNNKKQSNTSHGGGVRKERRRHRDGIFALNLCYFKITFRMRLKLFSAIAFLGESNKVSEEIDDHIDDLLKEICRLALTVILALVG